MSIKVYLVEAPETDFRVPVSAESGQEALGDLASQSLSTLAGSFG